MVLAREAAQCLGGDERGHDSLGLASIGVTEGRDDWRRGTRKNDAKAGPTFRPPAQIVGARATPTFSTCSRRHLSSSRSTNILYSHNHGARTCSSIRTGAILYVELGQVQALGERKSQRQSAGLHYHFDA